MGDTEKQLANQQKMVADLPFEGMRFLLYCLQDPDYGSADEKLATLTFV